MPTSIMQKNYSHCPLKKRPVHIVREENIKEGKKKKNYYISKIFYDGKFLKLYFSKLTLMKIV